MTAANYITPTPYPTDASMREQLGWRLAWDFEWVCANLVRIQTKSDGLQPFVWNKPQRVTMWLVQEQERRGLSVRQWCLKGRQLGISTLFTTRTGCKTAFLGQNGLILPQKERPGRRMFGKFEVALKYFPQLADGNEVVPYVPRITRHNTGDVIEFANDAALIRESGENRDAGVSETFKHAHLTEMPLWADAEHTMAGFLPTIPYQDPDTTVVSEFTARGEGDYTHQRWLEAEAGDGHYWANFLPWYWHDRPGEYCRPVLDSDAPLSAEERLFREEVREVGYEYPLVGETMELIPRLREKWSFPGRPVPSDLAVGFDLSMEQMMFRRDMLQEFRGDVDKWNREYPHTPSVAFQSSGRRLVAPSAMSELDRWVSRVAKEGDGGGGVLIDKGEYEVRRGSGGKARRVFRRREDGRVWRWEYPRAGSVYVVDADTSSGVGADSSGAHILRVGYREIRVVASFRGKIRPHDFARVLARMGSHYKSHAEFSAQTERLVGGRPSLLVVERNNHGEHVIHELDQTLKYRNLYRHDDGKGKKDKWSLGHDFGFPVYKNTKMKMLLNLSQTIFDEQFFCPCPRTRAEIRNLVYLDDQDQTAGAPRGSHDDMAMSVGEGVWVATNLGVFKYPRR